MMNLRFTAALLCIGLALPLLAGCDAAESSADASALATQEALLDAQIEQLDRQTARDIAAVRRATARFQRFEVAQDAGWYDPDAECVELPGVGGMGYHHINFGLMGDAEVAVTEPEALMYEPQQNGRLKLVGVEYIVPFEYLGPDEDPPVLFGMEFHPNPILELWALHAWVWEHNPMGMFADWNPRVSCEYAD